MKLKFIAALLLMLTFAACKSKNAFNYSENIVKKEKALEPFILETEDKIGKFQEAGQFDSLVACSERMEGRIEKAIGEIKAEAAPSGKEGEEFKQATVRYFTYMKEIYTSYKEVATQPTEEGRNEKLAKMIEFLKEKDKVIADMQAAQKKFAKANNFKIK